MTLRHFIRRCIATHIPRTALSHKFSNYASPSRLITTSLFADNGIGPKIAESVKQQVATVSPEPHSYVDLSKLRDVRFYKDFEQFLCDGKDKLVEYDFTNVAVDISDELKGLIRDLIDQVQLIHNDGHCIGEYFDSKKLEVYTEDSELVLKLMGDPGKLKKFDHKGAEHDVFHIGNLLIDVIGQIKEHMSIKNIQHHPNFGHDLRHFAERIFLNKNLFLFITWAADGLADAEYTAMEEKLMHIRESNVLPTSFWEKIQFAHVPNVNSYDSNCLGFVRCYRDALIRPQRSLLDVKFNIDWNRCFGTVDRYFRARSPDFFCVAVYTLHELNMFYQTNKWPENLPHPF